MGWCPKCRNEYVEGIAVCPDCNIDLTDELPAEENEMEPAILEHVSHEQIGAQCVLLLQHHGLQTAGLMPVQEDDETYEDGFYVVVASFEREAAAMVYKDFDSLEDMALDVFDLSRNYEIEQNLVSLKDSMMKNISSRTRVLSDFAHTILRKIESEMNDYKEKVTPNPNLESGPFKSFMDMRQEISELKDKTEKTEDKLSSQILNAKSKQDLEIAKTQIEVDIENMRLQMEKIETSLNGGL